MEIERKYIVSYLPDNLAQYESINIEQGYLSTNPTLRIRNADGVYVLTIKYPQQVSQKYPDAPIVNIEEEFPLTESSFLHLHEKCDSFVKKKRYRIPLETMYPNNNYTGLVAELDVFAESNDGLLLVEVEFPTVDAANAFIPPDWFGEDVSLNPAYKNTFLAK